VSSIEKREARPLTVRRGAGLTPEAQRSRLFQLHTTSLPSRKQTFGHVGRAAKRAVSDSCSVGACPSGAFVRGVASKPTNPGHLTCPKRHPLAPSVAFTSHFADQPPSKRQSHLSLVASPKSTPINDSRTASPHVRVSGGRPFGNQLRVDGVAADQVVRYSTSARRIVSPRLTPSSSARVSTNVTRSSGRRTE